MLAQFRQKCATAISQPPLFFVWLAPAWVLLGISRLIINTAPFKHYAHRLGVLDGTAPRTPLITRQQEARARIISSTIKVAAKYSPWEANCFPQAMAARCLLGLYNIPYALFFGLRREADSNGNSDAENALKAHAWIVCGPVIVTGGASFGQYQTVGCFVSE